MLLKKNIVSVVLFIPNLYIEANSFILYKFFKAIGSVRTKLDDQKTGIVLIKQKKEKKVILLKGQNNLLDYSKKVIRSKIFKSFIKIAPVVIPVILVIVICVPGVYADGRNSQNSDLPPYHFDGQPFGPESIEQMQPIQSNSKLFHSITNKFGRWLVVSCGILNVAEYGVRISRACKEGDYLGAGYYTGQIFLNGCSLAAGELSRKSLTPEDRTLFQGLQTVSLALSSTLRFYD
jgi:hypothetical protein|mmetsp:Transcript_8923/g.7964  ORF Transcript_8923/g.7964 Transcript_8923/m.7964 type:complete len:234 (+) Transcript_8923:3-704(+)